MFPISAAFIVNWNIVVLNCLFPKSEFINICSSSSAFDPTVKSTWICYQVSGGKWLMYGLTKMASISSRHCNPLSFWTIELIQENLACFCSYSRLWKLMRVFQSWKLHLVENNFYITLKNELRNIKMLLKITLSLSSNCQS